jgi:hypothetical protein
MVDHIWQKINAPCHSCHSWQECVGSMITAMTALIIILAAVALVIAIVRYVAHDGQGSTQPPSSHFTDPQLAAPSAGLGVRV